MADAPKRIYLQLYGADKEDLTPEEFKEHAGEMTWCTDRIYDTDVEYVLAPKREFYVIPLSGGIEEAIPVPHVEFTGLKRGPA